MESAETNISFEFNRKNGTLIVALSGEADLFGSSLLRQAMAEQLKEVTKVIFDLAKLDFADSYFLRLLLRLRRQVGGVASVKVVNAKPSVRRVFEVTGLDKLFL